jgi:hypothetical protein
VPKNDITIGTDEAMSPRSKFRLCTEHGTKNALEFSDKILVWTRWCLTTMFATLSYAWPRQSLRFISEAANCAFSSLVKPNSVLLIMCMKAMKYSLILYFGFIRDLHVSYDKCKLFCVTVVQSTI